VAAVCGLLHNGVKYAQEPPAMPAIRPSRPLRTGVAALLAALLVSSLAACSPSASPSASGGDGGGTGDHTVTITGTSFGDDFTIPAGSTVVFVNNAGRTHTVTEGEDGVAVEDAMFDISLEDGSSTDPIEFAEPGEYHVTCRIHHTMNLTITVE
jgi:plastocyanin